MCVKIFHFKCVYIGQPVSEISESLTAYIHKCTVKTIVRNYGFNCTFMYVFSLKFEYFGHWLSDVNTLQMKTFDTHLFFICNTSNYKPKISTKP